MSIYKRERVPKGIDKVGKEMLYHSYIFHIREWVPGGWVDSLTKWREARMPTCSTIIRSSGGRTCHMHYANVFTRPIERIANSKLPRRHSFVTIGQ